MSYPVFPVSPKMSVKKSIEWLTDVHESWDGEEQRVKLRVVPRQYYEIAFALKRFDKALLDAAIFANILHETGGVPDRTKWSLPIWNDMQKLTATLAIGSGSVSVTTTGYDFHAGGLVALIKARASYEFNRFACMRDENWELMTIDTLNATSITFTGVTTKAFASGDLILPARVAWLEASVDLSDETGAAQLYVGAAQFQCEIET